MIRDGSIYQAVVAMEVVLMDRRRDLGIGRAERIPTICQNEDGLAAYRSAAEPSGPGTGMAAFPRQPPEREGAGG